MALDREAAKAAGYTDNEIDAYLSALVPAAERAVEAGEAKIGEATPGRTLTELGGGIVGGLIAGAATRGKGTAAGKVAGETLVKGAARVLGAGAGGAGAELGYQAGAGEPVQPERAIWAGVRQMTAEGLGQGATRVVNRVIQPSRVAADVEAARLAPGFKAAGGEFLPHQAKPESGVFGWMTGAAEGGWFSATRMKHAGVQQEAAVKRLSESVADALSTKMLREVDPEDAAVALASTVFGGKEVHAEIRRQMFADLDTSGIRVALPVSVTGAGNKVLPLTENMTRTMGQLLARTAPAKAKVEAVAAKPLVDQFGKPAAVEAAPKGLTFERAQDLRSQLIARAGETRDPVLRGQYKLLAKAVDGQMEKAATELGDEGFVEAWRAANAFHKEGKRVFDNKFIANLASDPVVAEKFGEQIAGLGGAEPARKIRMAKEALTYAKQVAPNLDVKQSLDSIRAGWFQTRLATASKTGELQAGGLLSSLNQPKTQRLMRELFEPEQHTLIMDFAKTAQIAQRKPEGGGQMLVQLMQPGGLVLGGTLAVGGSVTAGGALGATAILAPPVVARLLTNPKTAKWLTYGLNTPLRSPARGGLYTRILASAAEMAQQGEIQITFPAGQEPGSPQSQIPFPAGPRLEQR